jgi:fatty-acyl-CoA synthase
MSGCGAPASGIFSGVSFHKGEIAHYKIPRYIEFVPEFPMTITGKIQKFVMR